MNDNGRRGDKCVGLEVRMFVSRIPTGGCSDLEWIRSLGHAQADNSPDVVSYQRFHSLKPDGIIGAKTRDQMARPRCGMPDILRAGQPQIPLECSDPVRVGLVLRGGTLPESTWTDELVWALESWNASCGINLVRHDNVHQSRIWGYLQNLDRNTLGWSYLPNGTCRQSIQQAYAQWIDRADQAAGTLLHEIGHALGLEHSPDQNDVMYPSIPWQFEKSSYPGPGDVLGVVQRYGPPETTEPPPTEEYTVLTPGLYRVQ